MLAAALIVFRESLEAALLIGIVAAAARSLPGRNRVLAVGVGAGLLGSLLVAAGTDSLAQLAGGAGQELFNALVLGVAVAMLGWHNVWMARHGAEMAAHAKGVVGAVREGRQELSAIAVVIALAVLREGSETALFLYGVATGGGLTPAGLVGGGLLGLLAGVAVGSTLYAGLLRIPLRWFFSVTGGLILMLAAGMAGQMARFLIQGDLLPAAGSPLWDSSRLLPPDSPLGTLLHVLMGYDARPSGMQVLFYATAAAIIWVGMRLARPAQRPAQS